MNSIFWLLLFLTASVKAGERVNLTQAFKDSGYETIPLRRTGQNHLYIVGRVEGQKRSCLIDTGWSFTTVATNKPVRLADSNLVARLELGGLVWTNVPVVTSDLRVNGQPTSYDVVLGCDFLLRAQAVIDCGAGKLHVRRRDEVAAKIAAPLTVALQKGGWVGVDLKRQSPPALTCAVIVNGQTTELLIDSGAMWSCLDQGFAKTAGLRTSVSPNRLAGPGASGKRLFAVADLKTWSFGAEKLPERTVAVLDLNDWGLGAGGKLFPEVGGILGGAELHRMEMLIDCGQLKLWWRRGR